MKVVPLNDKIVVKRLEAEEKTAGGIVLPEAFEGWFCFPPPSVMVAGSSLLAPVARCAPSSGNTERLPFADAEEMALSMPVAEFVMDLSFISRRH